jgi:hypothetical protein
LGQRLTACSFGVAAQRQHHKLTGTAAKMLVKKCDFSTPGENHRDVLTQIGFETMQQRANLFGGAARRCPAGT